MKKQIVFNWGEFNQRAGEDVTSNFTEILSWEILGLILKFVVKAPSFFLVLDTFFSFKHQKACTIWLSSGRTQKHVTKLKILEMDEHPSFLVWIVSN